MGSHKVVGDAELAKRLAEARVAAGKSLRQVARETGWSVARIQSYEAGTSSPTVRALRVLERVLGTPATMLLQGAERGFDAVPLPPGVELPEEEAAWRWVQLPEGGGDVLVCVGRVETPGYHVVAIHGRLVVAWVTAAVRGLVMQRTLAERTVAVRRKDVLGKALGHWRKA